MINWVQRMFHHRCLCSDIISQLVRERQSFQEQATAYECMLKTALRKIVTLQDALTEARSESEKA